MLSVFLKDIVLNIPLLFHEYVARNAPPSDIWKITWFKGPQWVSQAQDLASAFVVDNQMLLYSRKMYFM